ncbi:MAG: hypothetical protein MJ157_01620 [Clostridia bacterium]|nr:hypothetical protein [Clostridia bacterium]
MLKRLSLILVLTLVLAACSNQQIKESELLGEWSCVQVTTADQEYTFQQLSDKGISWILTFQNGGVGTTQSGNEEQDLVRWELKDNVVEVTDSFGDVYEFSYKDNLLYLQMEGNNYIMALKDSPAYQDFLEK